MSINNQNKPGYKHTPLGWIPEEWHVLSLMELSKNGISNGAFNDPRKVGSGYRLINVLDLYKEPCIDTSVLPRLALTEKEFKNNKVLKCDIFFTRSSIKLEGIAYCNINLEDADDITYDGHIMKLSPNGEIVVPEYLRLYCISYRARKFFMSRAKFNTMTTIGQDDISDMPVLVPGKQEQRKIAAILSTWDEAITITQQLIAQLQQRNKGLMQQLLTGKKRLKGFQREWNEVHLSDVFTERNETGYINLDLLSIGSLGVYPQSQSEKRDISNTDKSKYKRICPRDIGYNTMRMWQGRSALSSMEGIVSPAYTIVTPKDQQHSEFYAYLFKLPSVVNKFFRNSQGLVEDTLNCKFKDLANVKAEVPEYNEQVSIAQVIQQATDEVKLYEQKLAALQHQKKGLMQKLLTGEVRVKIDYSAKNKRR